MARNRPVDRGRHLSRSAELPIVATCNTFFHSSDSQGHTQDSQGQVVPHIRQSRPGSATYKTVKAPRAGGGSRETLVEERRVAHCGHLQKVNFSTFHAWRCAVATQGPSNLSQKSICQNILNFWRETPTRWLQPRGTLRGTSPRRAREICKARLS